MKQKIDAIKYEKSLREYNYHNKIIDAALDAKEKIFYEAIKEYNQELSEENLKNDITILVMKENHLIPKNTKILKFYKSEDFNKKINFSNSNDIILSAGVKKQFEKSGNNNALSQ